MKRRAFITGITGMDGSYLSEFLLEKDYEIVGLIRRHSSFESELGNVAHLQNDINFEYGDLTDQSSLQSAIMRSQPHEVYHLGAQSQVRISFDIPQATYQINALGTLNLLEAVREHSQYIRVYNASTSEMFGNSAEPDGTQNEKTRMLPVSPYGVSKLCAFHTCKNYRHTYGMHISSGILFNHESSRRGGNFVTMKIVRGALDIKHGKRDALELGNLKAGRDWGHAKDYVRGMWLMTQADIPHDFVLATGQTHTVEDFCKITFTKLGMDYTRYVRENQIYFRPNELHYLRGDASRAAIHLGWKPEISFDDMINEMIKGVQNGK